jgi:hypothetical protein
MHAPFMRISRDGGTQAGVEILASAAREVPDSETNGRGRWASPESMRTRRVKAAWCSAGAGDAMQRNQSVTEMMRIVDISGCQI